MRYRLLLFVIISLMSMGETLFAFAPAYWSSSSKLAQGKWMKMGVAESGVYKLTFDDLRRAGFSNPDRVKIYGYGGAMLSEALSIERPDDLPEVGVYKSLGSDGKFNAGDYLLFVAQGVRSIEWSASANAYRHRNNPYATQGYYFLSESEGESKLIGAADATGAHTATVTTFDDIVVHERDLKNITNTGREYYGEDFSYTTVQTFPFTIPGIVDSSPRITIDFIAQASGSTSLQVAVNGQNAIQSTMPQRSSDSYEKARAITPTGTFQPSSDGQYSTTVTYGRRGDQNVHLNYLRIEAKRTLQLYGNATFFRTKESAGDQVRLQIANATESLQLWEVTQKHQPKAVARLERGVFQSTVSPEREFLLLDPTAAFPTPQLLGSVENQNLHALEQTEMVIVAPIDFLASAQRLAQLHADRDGLHVTIVTPEQIFNEYSSGTPDATAIRLFLKMFYDRAEVEREKPRFLLLLGDGTYDNRKISGGQQAELANRILTFQSENSLSETTSYVTDDYFGFLDDGEGVNLSADNVDLGIGRIPARTRLEAEIAVRKIEEYVENRERSSWKNNLLFVADDGDNNLHMRDADALTQYIENNHADFVVNKVYLDAFKKQQTATGGLYPEAKRKMYEQLKQGTLMLNLTGHGNNTSWTSEQMVTMQDISTLYLNRLPLWVTATCDFSRFDDYTHSAGEAVLFHPEGGGIALFSTTRVVYSGPNYNLNSHFVRKIFAKDAEGHRLTLGEVMKESKRAIGTDRNKLSFMLLGDPAMKLAYPEYHARITTINGQSISAAVDTLKALGRVVMEGEILDHDGSVATWFDGSLEMTLFDSAERITTLDNGSTGNPFVFSDRSKLLFVGKERVGEGRFRIEFILSKDISYSNDKARINLYASDSEGNEAQGSYANVVVNGTADDVIYEENGPDIRAIYLNNATFKQGDRVNETPLLIVEIEDETGVNISQASIGHEMMVMIDNDPAKSYVVNAHFTPEAGNSRRGTVRFLLPELSEGDHALYFRAWDVFNNSSSATLEFQVVKGLTPELLSMHYDAHTPDNIPRAGGESIDFYVTHNRPEARITLDLLVYDLSGREVWRGGRSGISEEVLSFPLTWEMNRSAGGSVKAGIYIYRAYLSTESSRTVSDSKKMIILAQ